MACQNSHGNRMKSQKRITEVIAESMGSKDDLGIKEEAKKVEITCCSRLTHTSWGN